MAMIPSLRHEVVGPADAASRLRIAHLSDFHLWFSDRTLREIEPVLAEWQPDVLALTGDYADTFRGHRLAIDWIGRMAATYPLCWVAGNHDRWLGPSFVRKLEALSHAHSIDRRDAVLSGKAGGRYRFTAWPRVGRLELSGGGSEPVVVLLHNPAELDAARMPTDRRCLVLAGHLHGGQINLWHDRRGRPQPASWCFRWLVDRGQVGATPLIVSRGLGDLLPIRIKAPREIVIVDWAG
jgi:predicted MPP superfamily phosphohydrolase